MTGGDPIGLVFETGMLKRARRTGWWMAGIKDPESIADDSFRTAVIGTVLAAMEGADPARVSLLCTLHDTQETRSQGVSTVQPWIDSCRAALKTPSAVRLADSAEAGDMLGWRSTIAGGA